MRCCASPTTSIAAELRDRRDVASSRISRARDDVALGDRGDISLRARDVMNAVLFREILKPLAAGLGPLGEIATGAVADDLFLRRVR